ncbi:hypothetical protein BYT27DRAFT_7200770 [Phlegmacium glaucopus]|nr:hypothetical protein BYT27DRAFT_7200770 [Phlegmacium glaucopus]
MTPVPATMVTLSNDAGIMLSRTKVFMELFLCFYMVLIGELREGFKISNDTSHFFDVIYARIVRKK